MRLARTYSIRTRKIEFEFTPYHKFNFLMDDSGKGKTVVLKEIAYNAGDSGFLLWYSVGNLNYITQPCDKLIMFDESQFLKFIERYGVDTLNNSNNAFLIVCRELQDLTSVDYRAIYCLKADNKKYSVVRKFDDYKTFTLSSLLITEDSGIGYDYYNRRFANVISANGKKDICNKLKDDCTVIADGSAFVYEFIKCLKSRHKVNYFLPDSFEGLVLENTKQAEKCVREAHEDPVLKYLSIERYYTDKIKEFYPGYSKTCNNQKILNMDLLHLESTDVHSKRKQRAMDYITSHNENISKCSVLASPVVCDELNATTDEEKAYVYLATVGYINWLPEDS